MIQRIQTIWLLLAATCMALAFQFKFAAGFTIQNTATVPKNVTTSTHILSLVLALCFLAITLYTIFMFKNRSAQIKLTILNIIIGAAVLYSLYWQSNSLTNITYAIAALLPIFAIGFTVSALHCIWQDQKKIKDLNSNRLR